LNLPADGGVAGFGDGEGMERGVHAAKTTCSPVGKFHVAITDQGVIDRAFQVFHAMGAQKHCEAGLLFMCHEERTRRRR
jgi:hypothetical protein